MLNDCSITKGTQILPGTALGARYLRFKYIYCISVNPISSGCVVSVANPKGLRIATGLPANDDTPEVLGKGDAWLDVTLR